MCYDHQNRNMFQDFRQLFDTKRNNIYYRTFHDHPIYLGRFTEQTFRHDHLGFDIFSDARPKQRLLPTDLVKHTIDEFRQ